MMKVIAGSMVGGLVAGTIALVATATSEGRREAPFDEAPAALTERTEAAAGDSIVQCEPQQQAVLRRSIVDGREVSTISCVTTASLMPAASVNTAAMNSLVSPVGYAPAPAAAMTQAAAVQPAVIRERIVEREAPRKAKRSWQKTALVIGGTSGAGAGIGALIGGKKGALIGAAIGGGSGAIYEVTKR